HFQRELPAYECRQGSNSTFLPIPTDLIDQLVYLCHKKPIKPKNIVSVIIVICIFLFVLLIARGRVLQGTSGCFMYLAGIPRAVSSGYAWSDSVGPCRNLVCTLSKKAFLFVLLLP